MNIGIYIENCRNVELTNNWFHNVDRPVVAKGTKGIVAKGNVATYGEIRNGLKPLVVAKGNVATYGEIRNGLKPLVVAIRKIIYG
ncbi:hypothetical protein G3495_11105 [Shewanella baltica]|uniref:hypothetical protein n=1 Tax=Shewanella baltica TaxID=62322 RepID=UPI00217DFDF1|nr:hypothetical protein [Shewanella baltica]MCS6235668.1 hypothetical protein [Shewanella baltica]MCS6270169.1 hypothetical protein [Shewanella baltica]